MKCIRLKDYSRSGIVIIGSREKFNEVPAPLTAAILTMYVILDCNRVIVVFTVETGRLLGASSLPSI